MDRHLAAESIAPRFLAFAPQPGVVAEIDIDGVDRRDERRGGAREAENAGEPVGIEKAPLRVAVGFRTKLGGQIFGPPGQPAQPCARGPVGAGEKQRLRGLGRDRHDLDVPVRNAGDRFARRQLGVGMDDGGAAFRLRKHDGIGPRRHHRVEIGIGQSGLQPVDAHEQARPRRLSGRFLQE